jgi:peptidoglycan hydrolase-like protein with peptidoglycan-binding domain
MESLVFLHDAIAYEDPQPELRFASWDLAILSGSLRGGLSLAVLLAVLNQVSLAQAALKMGDRGGPVAKLQQELRIQADGVFGPQTQAYVTAYQRLSGLPITGIADTATLAALGLPADGPAGNAAAPPTQPQTAQPVATTAATRLSAVVIASSGLNVRDTAAGEVVRRLDHNQTVRLTGDRRTAGRHHWVQLAEGGWVAAEYLSLKGEATGEARVPPAIVQPPATKPVTTPQARNAGGRVSARTGLIVRETPGGPVVGSLLNGQTVKVKGDRKFANGRDWVQLATGGWVAADYVAMN